MKRKLKPLTKEILGIQIVKDLGMNNDNKPKREAIFKCFCGVDFRAKINAVATGQKKSCGCYKKKYPTNKTHGLSKHRLYRKWSGMITRCTNPKENHWHRYGGRGITIYKEWRDDFKLFYDWAISNGYKDGLTIDRIDVDGNYDPSNCQWITMKENTLKDKVKFNPSESIKIKICKTYKETHITVTKLAEVYSTHKERISNILKENNIRIVQRRMKCY